MTIRYATIFKMFLIAVLTLGAAACHEDNDEDEENGGNGAATGTRYYEGRFIDAGVENLLYEVRRAGSDLVQRRGRTDADGVFDYLRNQAFRVRFFLGDDTAESAARLQLGEISFSSAEANTSGIIVSPASLHPDNPALAVEIARFLQGADSDNDFGIQLDNLLHTTLAENPQLAEAQAAVNANTNIVSSFASVFQELNYEAAPDADAARAHLHANLLCQSVGAYRIEEGEDNEIRLRGAFVIDANGTATGVVFDEEDAEYALDGQLGGLPQPLLYLDADDEDALLPDLWSGAFNHRFDEISTENRNFSPDFSARRIEKQLTPPEWILAAILPGTPTLLVLRLSGTEASGFVYDPDTELRTEIDGDYDSEDDSFSASNDDLSISTGTLSFETGAGTGATRFFFRRDDGSDAEELEDIPICRP